MRNDWPGFCKTTQMWYVLFQCSVAIRVIRTGFGSQSCFYNCLLLVEKKLHSLSLTAMLYNFVVSCVKLNLNIFCASYYYFKFKSGYCIAPLPAQGHFQGSFLRKMCNAMIDVLKDVQYKCVLIKVQHSRVKVTSILLRVQYLWCQ